MPVKGRPRKAILSDQQKLFVENYVNNPNARDAARKAGYSEASVHATAPDLMSHPVIKKEIELKLEERLSKIGITFEDNITKAMAIVDACMQGRASDKGLLHPAGAVGALDLVNRMAGFYAPEKRETDINSKVRGLTNDYERDV